MRIRRHEGGTEREDKERNGNEGRWLEGAEGEKKSHCLFV